MPAAPSAPSYPGGNEALTAALSALNPSGQSTLGTTLQSFAPNPTAAASGATTPYDFNSDPVFQQANAIIARTEEQAQAQATARKTQMAIQYGDASGLGLGKTTEATATNNPFSVIAAEKRSYDTGVTKLEDQLNKSNLYFSGWRGKELGAAATGYQQNQYNARSRFQAGIQDVDNQLQSALLQAEWSRLAAMQSGYQRGLQNPGAAGSDPNAQGPHAGGPDVNLWNPGYVTTGPGQTSQPDLLSGTYLKGGPASPSGTASAIGTIARKKKKP